MPTTPIESRFAAPRTAGVRARYLTGLFLIAVGAMHLVVFAIDGGPWDGPVSWRKPITFGVSFGLSVLTITWVSGLVPLAARTRALLTGAFTVASVVEVALVTLQAWRRVPSHFNLETTFDGVVSRILAAGGGVIVAVVAALTITAFRTDPAIPPSTRLAVRAGFVALLSAMAFGAIMIARGMTDVTAGHPAAAYTEAGWLRPAHAVTMHAVLLLPAIDRLLARTGRSQEDRLRAVRLATALYAAVAVLVTVAALAGATVLPPATAAMLSAAIVATPALVILALSETRISPSRSRRAPRR